MKWEDLPESDRVADRRGVKEPETLKEMEEAGTREPRPERGLPYSDSDLARQAGIRDLAAEPRPILAILKALAAAFRR